eukprot:Skav222685  [mRNA]  locus=scaffold1471:104632:106200:- [translate_table: standard]
MALTPWHSALVATTCRHVKVDVIAFNISLNGMSRFGMWIRALNMLKSFKQTLRFNVITLGSLVKCCTRAIAWLSSLQLYTTEFLSTIPANEIVMNSVMASLTERWRKALRFLVSDKRHVDVISYNTVLRSKWNWWKSLQLMMDMTARGLCGTVVTLNTLLSSLPWLQAWTFLKEAENRCGDKVDTLSYNSCIKGSRWTQVLALRHQMLPRRLEVTAVTFTSIMTTLETTGMWQEAVAHFELWNQQWYSAQGEATIAVSNAAINGLGQNGEWAKSLSLTYGLMASGVLADIITWGSTIMACESMERWQRALVLCAEVWRHREAEQNHIIFNAAACACAQGEQWQQALQLLRNAMVCQVELNILVYNSILAACSKAARWQESLEVLAHLNRRKTQWGVSMASIKTYNTVLSALSAETKWREAG